jgi:hypothetical protein
VYAGINGLKVFCEIRGPSDQVKIPVLLLHGAISATGTSFGLYIRPGRRGCQQAADLAGRLGARPCCSRSPSRRTKRASTCPTEAATPQPRRSG